MEGNFPEIYKLTTSDDLRPAMQHALVHNGRIVATNAHVLIFSKISTIISDEDERAAVEGKVFSRELLQKMSAKKWKRIEFLPNEIRFYTNKGYDSSAYYTGVISDNPDRIVVKVIDPITGEFKTNKELDEDRNEVTVVTTFVYPNWTVVIPFFDRGSFELNVDDLENKTGYVHTIGIAASLLADIANCFYNKTGGVVIQNTQYKLVEEDGSISVHSLYRTPNRPLIITPVGSDFQKYDEVALLIPTIAKF